MERTIVFVCPHGALKSRLAAAFFNRVAPPGWIATAAGQQPQPAVSQHAIALVAGTDIEALLDTDPPRPLAGTSDLIVAIDCAIEDAVGWRLAEPLPGEAMRDELRLRAEQMARELADVHP